MTVTGKWTKEEDNILVQAVKANPHNKAQAFRQASKEIHRSFGACCQRWYSVLGNPENKKYVGTCFTMLGEASSLCNRSIHRYGVHVIPMRHKKSIWETIKNLLNLK